MGRCPADITGGDMGEKKLKTKDILGYTIGSIGDSTSYNFVLSFFSFFMITVAGVSPVVAQNRNQNADCGNFKNNTDRHEFLLSDFPAKFFLK